MSQQTSDDVVAAHKFCVNNKPALLRDHLCGCFFCLSIFSPSEIEEYTEGDATSDDLETAICPYCDTDSVISESSGFPITKEFLTRMHRRWYDSGSGLELNTPFGKVTATFDGKPISFEYLCIDPDKRLFPDVDGAYRIKIDYVSDGREHTLLFLLSDCESDGEPETGERLEAVSFYPRDGKITLGCYASFGDYKDYPFDFDGTLRKNGIEISVLPETKTRTMLFGVSWVEHCTEENDVQTWFGADSWP